jgi:hypothetical protein
MENPIDGTDGKLGCGFMSDNKLEEIDIGDGDKMRTMCGSRTSGWSLPCVTSD